MSRKSKGAAADAAPHKDQAEAAATPAEEAVESADADEVIAAEAPQTDTSASEGPADGDADEAVDELTAMRLERDALQDRLMRLAAEFDNFRKRSAREWKDYRERATSEVLREMIDLVDNFERALEASTEDAEGLRRGIELIHQQLLSSLKKFGIESVSAEGMEFDPKLHEALMMVDSDDVASQHVVQVIQKGYALNGEILRPARVSVSK